MTDLRRRPRPLRRTGTRVSAAALVLGLVAAGCGGDDEPQAAEPTRTPSATPTTTAPAPPQVDPITGTGAKPSTSVVAVKVDNAPLARPYHRGLEGASVLYLELVEGGATRFVAVYSQPFGKEVGPIRSFRESDVELLAQYGRPAVGFSGAAGPVLAAFRAAVQRGVLANASFDDHPSLYRIGERRRDAKNFYAVPTKMAGVAKGDPARSIGWTHSPTAPAGPPATSARIVFSDRSAVQVQYDAASRSYRMLQEGAPLAAFSASNVVVQQVPVRASGIRDVTGAVTPFSHTVGSGDVHVLRDGVRVQGRWHRADPQAVTRLVDAAGKPIPLRPGPTLVLLQPAGLPFSPA